MLLSRIWNLTVLLLFYSKTLLLSCVMSLSITVRSTQEFRRLYTSGNTAVKLADNEVGSTGSPYLSNPFQYGKSMSPYSSVPHEHTDTYKTSIFRCLWLHLHLLGISILFYFPLHFLLVCVHRLAILCNFGQ